jgi:acyl-coenzyme A synthetase/AMP-(fatty) acid ligase
MGSIVETSVTSGNARQLAGPFGRRLLVSLTQERAKHTPNEQYCLIPRTDDPKDGFINITWSILNRCVDQMSWWLEKTIQKDQPFEVSAYMGPQDVRFLFVILAGMKTGHVILLSSPRNSVQAQQHLFQQTGTKRLLHGGGVLVEDLLAGTDVELINIPSLVEFLDFEKPVKPYLYTKTFAEGVNDPVFVMHTSGTTGMPKPYTWTNRSVSVNDMLNEPLPGEQPFQFVQLGGHLLVGGMPVFHLSGVATHIIIPHYFGLRNVWLPVNAPPNVELYERVLDCIDVDGLTVPPSILEDLAKTPASLAKMLKMRFLVFGGGMCHLDALFVD